MRGGERKNSTFISYLQYYDCFFLMLCVSIADLSKNNSDSRHCFHLKSRNGNYLSKLENFISTQPKTITSFHFICEMEQRHTIGLEITHEPISFHIFRALSILKSKALHSFRRQEKLPT